MRVSRPLRQLSLFWQVFLIDAAVLVVITVLLAVSPITISAPIKVDQLAVLLAGLVVLLLVTLAILRRTLSPLEELTQTMREIDPLSPGQAAHRPRTSRRGWPDADGDAAADRGHDHRRHRSAAR
jgi:hypothetical protein